MLWWSVVSSESDFVLKSFCRCGSHSVHNTGVTVKTFMLFASLLIGSVAFAQQPAAAPTAPGIAQVQSGPSMGGGNCRDSYYNCAATPNPLPPANTVWIEEMTWMDVR